MKDAIYQLNQVNINLITQYNLRLVRPIRPTVPPLHTQVREFHERLSLSFKTFKPDFASPIALMGAPLFSSFLKNFQKKEISCHTKIQVHRVYGFQKL